MLFEVRCVADTASTVQYVIFFSQSQLSVQTLLQIVMFVQLLCAITCIKSQVKIPKHWQSYRWLDTNENTDQTSKTECGRPRGKGTENGHIGNLSPVKRVFYRLKKGNAEEGETLIGSLCDGHAHLKHSTTPGGVTLNNVDP